MKIGIITFHRAHNYGAVLQCYALCNYLKDSGNHIEVVDYCPSCFEEQYSFWPLYGFKHASIKGKVYVLYKFFLTFVSRLYRYRHFRSFVQTIPMSKKKTETDGDLIANDYDIILWGSDQVWNPRLTCNKIDRVFTGKIKKGNTLFASYAASTTIKKNDEYRELYKEILNIYDFISVRESSLEDYLKSLGSKEIITVADPVLLLEKKAWQRMSKTPKDKDYLLVYTVPQHPNIMKIAKKIAQEKNLKIIEIVPREKISFNNNCRQKVSPEEFVGYFNSASFVVTTSFHGTAFAIKMQKQFITLLMGNDIDNRSLSLLHKLGIEERGVSINNLDISCNNTLDYSVVDSNLTRYLDESKSFISKIISNDLGNNHKNNNNVNI